MLKKLHVLLLVLLAAVCFTATAWADYDYIEQYGVMVTPNTEDGSLLITVKLEWTPLEELPYGQELKIGVPNGSIRDVAAQTDNIERLDFDNSYMYVYLTQGYDKDETFSFAYSWVQEYMYQLDGSAVTYDYTPGWFDEARIGQMTLIWNDPAGLTGDFTEGTVSGADSVTVQNGMAITASDLDYGYKMNVQVRYTDWPTQLSEEYSADNVPDGGWNGSDDYYYDDDDTGDAIIGMMVTIFVVIFILVLISAARRGDGYAGGFGTRYVFVNHLWYPAGPDGRPRPGSVGTKTKPRPPRSGGGGFGGGSRGGGSIQRARGGQLLLQLVHLLLQIVAFQLPDVGVFLGFPLGGLEGGRLFLDGLQLLVRLAALGLGRVCTLGRGSQLGLQGLHAAVGGAPLAAQLPAWTAAAAAGGCTPARAAGPRWPARSCKPAHHFYQSRTSWNGSPVPECS